MSTSVTRINDGACRVEVEGTQQTFYVAGTAGDRWVWWNGEAYRITSRASAAIDVVGAGLRPARPRPAVASTLEITAPMPARVLRLMVKTGDTVRKGDTLILLEAMKMELPLRADGDATVQAVHCQDGQLVQADALLIELS